MTNDDFNADAQSDKKVASDGSGTTRRTVLKGATATAAGLTLGSSMVGNSMAQAGQGIPTPKLEREGNKLVDECGNEVILRGVNIVDPARANRGWRGATADEMIEMATANTDWPNTVIRLPMQPQDISAAPDRSGNNESHHIHGDNWGPALPVAFTQEELDTYLERFVDPLVDMAAERGFYIQLDYHRHYPIFHQAQYEDEVSEWQRCGQETFANDYGMCGERGVLWHGADQVDEIQSLDGAPDDAYFETESSEVNNNGGANVAEAFDEEMTMFWSTVADRYAGEPHVIFDIFNEPTGPYAGDWGTPTREPGEGGEVGLNTDVQHENAEPFWELFLERVAPWIKIVEENAPGSVKTVGSPRWSQYTYWAKDHEVQDVGSTYSDITNMCYTGHRYTHESLQPMGEYYGAAAEEVPMFFNEWGWFVGGGNNDFVFIDGATEEYPSDADRGEDWVEASAKANQAEDYQTFFDEYPVHPIAWNFDHTWDPPFFQGEAFDELVEYNRGHAQWWQEYVQSHADEDQPQDPDSEDCEDTTTPTPTGPSMPSSLSQSDSTASSVTVTWSEPSSTGAGIDYYRVETAGMSKQVSGTTATVEGLDSDTDYDVSVTAVDTAGNTSNAATTVATTDTSDGTTPSDAEVYLEMASTTDSGMAKANIMLSQAPSGLSGYRVAVTVADTSVATIANAMLENSPMQTLGDYPQYSDDGSTVTIAGADLSEDVGDGAEDIQLGSVTFQAETESGSTDVMVAVQNIDNNAGDAFPVSTSGTTLQIGSTGPGPINGTEPTDPDGDGLYEDLNGNGEVDYDDIVIYFNHMEEPELTDYVDYYDFNDNDDIDFDDVVQLFGEVN
ncbi:fibronectin type III domain-containing protein [Halomicrobium salinisoli]|uniref:fibronectin type III domain-containing protein n=1 Tax=Halomicrobium salinisoli TaxID=2878391 RepID=UPI001CF04F37|nr:cellulase family glycosylhydrolase [Halomicrobium salinisoli]